MQTSNFAWIIAAVMAVVAIFSWVYNLNTENVTSPTETVITEPDENTAELALRITELTDEMNNLSQAHDGLIKENTALRTLNENLKSESEQASDRVAELTTQLEQAESESDAAKVKLDEVLSQAQKRVTESVVAETEVETADESEPTAETVEITEVSSSGPKLEEALKQIRQLESENSDLNSKVLTLSANVANAKERIDVLLSDESEPNEKFQSLMANLETADLQIVKLQAENAALNEKVQTLTADPESAAAQIEQLESENAALNGKVQTFTADPDSTPAQIAKLESENSDLNVKLQALTVIQEVTSEKASSLESENLDLNAKIQDLMAQLEAAITKSNSFQSENSNLNDDVQDLTDDLEKINARASKLQTANQSIHAENLSLGSKLGTAQMRVDVLTTENVSLNDKLQNLTGALNQANANLADANADIRYLSTRLRYASKHLRRIRKDIRMSEFESEQLVMLQEQLASSLGSEIEAKQTQIKKLLSDYSAITLESDVVFESGSVELNQHGEAALRNVSEQLRNYPNRIVSIEGHTDNETISARLAQFYPSNWELSSARASEAANFLVGLGIAEERFRVVGHGPMRPIASNDSEQGRAANRRIEIRLVPELAEKDVN